MQTFASIDGWHQQGNVVMPTAQNKPLLVKIINPQGTELFWPHAQVPRMGEKITMKTADDYKVNGVQYVLDDAAHKFTAFVSVIRWS